MVFKTKRSRQQQQPATAAAAGRRRMANCLFIVTVPKVLESDTGTADPLAEAIEQEEEEQAVQKPLNLNGEGVVASKPIDDEPNKPSVCFALAAGADSTEELAEEDERRMESLSASIKRKMTPAEIVRAELEFVHVDYSCTLMHSGQFIQIQFMYPSAQAETLLVRFVRLGIGRQNNTSVNLFNPSVCQIGDNDVGEFDPTGSQMLNSADADDRLQTFLQSMRSRLMVSQVYHSVMDKGRWTFDFVCFLVCAAAIASVGLATNSSVMTVASMLLSPLMGPILALTFSWRLRRREAVLSGLVNTLLALVIIFATGFVLLFVLIFPLLGMGFKEFPSKEMADRGLYASLAFGVLVAFASSYGVCVSVLQGDHSANVGVAISASLLPPVVNSGMLLAYTALLLATPPRLLTPEEAAVVGGDSPLNCTFRHFGQFVFRPTYTCDMVLETLVLSLLSLLLCVLNIAIIIAGSYAWLTLKEVAPDALTRNEAIRDFYKRDIKVARDNCLHGDSRNQLLKEFETVRQPTDLNRLRREFETVEDILKRQTHRTICGMQSNSPPVESELNEAEGAPAAENVQLRYLARLAQHSVTVGDARRRRPKEVASPKAKKMGRFSVKERFVV